MTSAAPLWRLVSVAELPHGLPVGLLYFSASQFIPARTFFQLAGERLADNMHAGRHLQMKGRPAQPS